MIGSSEAVRSQRANLLGMVLEQVELPIDAPVFPAVEQFEDDDGLRVAEGGYDLVRSGSPHVHGERMPYGVSIGDRD